MRGWPRLWLYAVRQAHCPEQRRRAIVVAKRRKTKGEDERVPWRCCLLFRIPDSLLPRVAPIAVVCNRGREATHNDTRRHTFGAVGCCFATPIA